MTNRRKLATATVLGAAVVFGMAGAGSAAADPATADFGTSQRLTDGTVISAYTVTEPEPSDDIVNVPVEGHLYESTVTVDAVKGMVTPVIPFFNARTEDGQNYRVLFQAFAPAGLSADPLPQGEETTGKIYFDVTGAAPTSVFYNDAVQDRLMWD